MLASLPGGGPIFCIRRPSTSMPAVVTEPTAALNEGILSVIFTSAMQFLPVLQKGATRCPWSSYMPMLQGLFVRSALTVATT